MTRRLIFATCTVERHTECIVTSFTDGTLSCFYPPVSDPAFRECARKFGYVDVLQYGFEHDETHSLLANYLKIGVSEVVWADAHGGVREKDPKVYDDEEHLVNRMLYYVNTGKPDEDYGRLAEKYGFLLPVIGRWLWQHLRT